MGERIVSVDEIAARARELRDLAVELKASKELGYDEERDGPPQRMPHASPDPFDDKEHWRQLHAAYAWVPDLFVDRVGPDPANFDQLIDRLGAASDRLVDRRTGVNAVEEPVELARNHLRDWHDATAPKFLDYLVRLKDATRRQGAVAETLRHAMHANRQIYVNTRADLYAIAGTATTALHNITARAGESAVVALNVFSAVASVAAAVAGPEIAAVGIGWDVVSGGSALAALGLEHTAPKPVETDLDADTVDGVLAKTIDAVQRTAAEAERLELTIVGALRRDLGQLVEHRAAFVVRPT